MLEAAVKAAHIPKIEKSYHRTLLCVGKQFDSRWRQVTGFPELLQTDETFNSFYVLDRTVHDMASQEVCGIPSIYA